MPLDYFVWAIKGPDRTFVFDTGFDAPMGEKRQRQFVRSPVGGAEGDRRGARRRARRDPVAHALRPLRQLRSVPARALPPAGHRDGVCTGRCMCHAGLRAPFEEDDVVAMVRKLFAGRVVFHDGVDELAPGLTRASRRRALEGAAGGAGVDAARLDGAGVGRQPLLCQHGARPRVSDHAQPRGHAGGLRDDAEAGECAERDHSGARSAGAAALSGGETGAGGDCRCGWTSSPEPELPPLSLRAAQRRRNLGQVVRAQATEIAASLRSVIGLATGMVCNSGDTTRRRNHGAGTLD